MSENGRKVTGGCLGGCLGIAILIIFVLSIIFGSLSFLISLF